MFALLKRWVTRKAIGKSVIEGARQVETNSYVILDECVRHLRDAEKIVERVHTTKEDRSDFHNLQILLHAVQVNLSNIIIGIQSTIRVLVQEEKIDEMSKKSLDRIVQELRVLADKIKKNDVKYGTNPANAYHLLSIANTIEKERNLRS